jgi:hypothetical protein
LSVRLSNIDIIPGQWMPIEFFSGILPSELMGGSKKLNQNSVVGLTLVFAADARTNSLALQMPFSGYVRKRLHMQGFSGWFMVELEFPLQIGNEETRLIYIRAENASELISNEEETVVGIFARISDGEKSKLAFVDWAVAM